MPLNSSGRLSLSGSTVGESIAIEKGRAANATVTMPDDLRNMTGKFTGPITIPTQLLHRHEPNEQFSWPVAVGVGNSYTVYITNGIPNGTVRYSGTYAGSLTLDDDGAGSYTVTADTEGDFNVNFEFDNESHSRNITLRYYNEVITAPDTVITGTAFDINISRGAANTSFTYTGAASGTGTLDGSGNAVFSGVVYTSDGTYNYSLTFAATGDVRTVSIISYTPYVPPADGGGGGDGGGAAGGGDGGGDGGGGGGDGGGGGGD